MQLLETEKSVEFRPVILPQVYKHVRTETPGEVRTAFWELYDREGFEPLCRQYAKITLLDRFLYGFVRPTLIRLHLLRR